MSPVCPTVYPGCPGTAWGVKTRVKDPHLRFCELYGTPGNCPEPRNGACRGRCTVSATSRTGFARSLRSPAAWQSADSGRARADQAALARQRRRPPSRLARPTACVTPGEVHGRQPGVPWLHDARNSVAVLPPRHNRCNYESRLSKVDTDTAAACRGRAALRCCASKFGSRRRPLVALVAVVLPQHHDLADDRLDGSAFRAVCDCVLDDSLDY